MVYFIGKKRRALFVSLLLIAVSTGNAASIGTIGVVPGTAPTTSQYYNNACQTGGFFNVYYSDGYYFTNNAKSLGSYAMDASGNLYGVADIKTIFEWQSGTVYNAISPSGFSGCGSASTPVFKWAAGSFSSAPTLIMPVSTLAGCSPVFSNPSGVVYCVGSDGGVYQVS